MPLSYLGQVLARLAEPAVAVGPLRQMVFRRSRERTRTERAVQPEMVTPPAHSAVRLVTPQTAPQPALPRLSPPEARPDPGLAATSRASISTPPQNEALPKRNSAVAPSAFLTPQPAGRRTAVPAGMIERTAEAAFPPAATADRNRRPVPRDQDQVRNPEPPLARALRASLEPTARPPAESDSKSVWKAALMPTHSVGAELARPVPAEVKPATPRRGRKPDERAKGTDPTVEIGSIEVIVTPAPPAPASVFTDRPAAAVPSRLAHGFSSGLGLRQS